jgi:hypothetical protein
MNYGMCLGAVTQNVLKAGVAAVALVMSQPGHAQECTLAELMANLKTPAVVRPSVENDFIVESKEKGKIVTQYKRVPCLEADLLNLNFGFKDGFRAAPSDSTSGTYESVSVWQNDNILVTCFHEFALDKLGPAAKLTAGRLACHQLVPVRYATNQ